VGNTPAGANWSGTYRYRAGELHRPASVEELRRIVAGAPQVRVLGTRHSFNDIADSAALIDLSALPADVVVDRTEHTVTCNAAMTYGQLGAHLESAGLALHNLASLPHISIGGAIATATHGSGDALGNLATAVAGLEILTSSGDVITARRGDTDFDGMVVGLGALGAVTRVTLDVQPAFEVRQVVHDAVEWSTLLDHFDQITASGYSVSTFTLWDDSPLRVWVKSRADAAALDTTELLGRIATVDLHPVPGLSAEHCTTQRGIAGPWWDRLPHFRMGFTPSSGDEIQSELLLPRAHAASAIEALRELAPAITPLLLVSEIRTVAADSLWMSPQQGRDCVAFHFTWKPDETAVLGTVAVIEAALTPFDARAHWGKVFVTADASARYPRHADFLRLVDRLDPRGAFRNDWFEHHVI
jgi:xylitol oxidase